MIRFISFYYLSTLQLFAVALALTACSEASDRDQTAPAPIDRSEIAPREVMIGFDGPRFDACGRNGRVYNLPFGEDAVSVREAPANSADEVDTLAEGTVVAMCQRTGGWVGIVYPAPATNAPPTDSESDGETEPTPASADAILRPCGTTAPVPETRAYDGPCRAGWVSDDYLRLVTG